MIKTEGNWQNKSPIKKNGEGGSKGMQKLKQNVQITEEMKESFSEWNDWEKRAVEC